MANLTITEIIAWVDRYFPNQVSDANCILDLDVVQKEVFIDLKRLKNEFIWCGCKNYLRFGR